ncbi:MAG: putative hydro-lyase [Alphaproteobacteria bacterium]|nr:putative hydro-lyase [Alphaproteobacteria bacterium]
MVNATASNYTELRSHSVEAVREAIRANQYTGHTAGLAPGKLQANLAILPQEYALDFMRFCQRNPKPCPLVGVSETGDPMLHTLGRAIDVRTDVPGYNIYRNGEMTGSQSSINDLWNDDLVAFALGCSFTFENALLNAGIALWHIEDNKTVPMYRTSLQTVDAGAFGGGTVVSMRAMPANRVEEAIEISSRYPWAHGSPVHIGDPAEIGIADLNQPDWGDQPPALDDTVPVFWACGVTPQNAIMRAKLPLCITHTPGKMLITDIDEAAETPII